MISRLIKQAIQLFADKKLRPYWVSRGMVASLFFLFGILLREAGYEANEVLVAWIFVYITQALLLLSLDKVLKSFSSGSHNKMVVACSVLACTTTIGMIALGVNLWLFSFTTIMLLPVLREAIHNGTLYVRDRKWEFGANLASLCANELGKAFGALFIFLFGYISSIDERFMAAFLLVLIGLSIRSHNNAKRQDNVRSYDPHLKIGHLGRGYVSVASIHNGAFTAIKAILSLMVFEILSEKADIDSIITTLATAVSVVLLFGMALFQIIQNHIEPLLKSVYKNGLFTISLLILTCFACAGFSISVLFSLGLVNAKLAAYGLAITIAMIIAMGSLFTLGSLQFLDKAFGTESNEGFDLRKSTLHHAWIGSSFAPSVFLGIYLGLLLFWSPLLSGIICLGLIFITEIYVTVSSVILMKQASILEETDADSMKVKAPS